MLGIKAVFVRYLLPYRHQLLFLIFGGSLFLLNAGLQYIVKEKLFIEAGITNVIVTLFLYVLQFLLNAGITWGDRKATFRQNLKRAKRYIPIKVILWTINTGLDLWFLSLGMHYQVANALAVLLIMLVNYFVFDKVIFVSE